MGCSLSLVLFGIVFGELFEDIRLAVASLFCWSCDMFGSSSSEPTGVGDLSCEGGVCIVGLQKPAAEACVVDPLGSVAKLAAAALAALACSAESLCRASIG
jgi:hypothetical protein